jgi:uncharacterized protein (TIGR02246 family)
MRKLMLVSLALGFVSTVALAEGPKVDPSISASVKKFTDSFNTFDPKAVASYWAEDGTLISPAGQRGNGRDAVAKVYAADIDMILKGTTSTFRVESARMLKGGYALLDLDHEIANAKMPDGSTGTMKLHTVILARKKGSGWEWLDARPYAFLRPPPPAAGSPAK